MSLKNGSKIVYSMCVLYLLLYGIATSTMLHHNYPSQPMQKKRTLGKRMGKKVATTSITRMNKPHVDPTYYFHKRVPQTTMQKNFAMPSSGNNPTAESLGEQEKMRR